MLPISLNCFCAPVPLKYAFFFTILPNPRTGLDFADNRIVALNLAQTLVIGPLNLVCYSNTVERG